MSELLESGQKAGVTGARSQPPVCSVLQQGATSVSQFPAITVCHYSSINRKNTGNVSRVRPLGMNVERLSE